MQPFFDESERTQQGGFGGFQNMPAAESHPAPIEPPVRGILDNFMRSFFGVGDRQANTHTHTDNHTLIPHHQQQQQMQQQEMPRFQWRTYLLPRIFQHRAESMEQKFGQRASKEFGEGYHEI
eukprot:GDKI01042786.1.p1 GENE.GDKI01042786.1~~GDKI01042786.1.p1  ORF type:complete len:122 (-),score=20.02 GDKI01042786.1:127-492(-)